MNAYITQIITEDDLSKITPGSFNVLRAPRGYGKTTFMFDDRVLNFSRAKKHVLYLIHNGTTRDLIAAQHSDIAKVFEINPTDGWLAHRSHSLLSEEDEDLVHVMCYQTFAALLRKSNEWLQDIDLIVWDEFDDIKTYYEKEIRQIKKVLPAFSRNELAAVLQRGRPSSVVNFVYQIKNEVLDPGRIKLLAISATPEEAACYFKDYVNFILKGQLEEKYAAENTIFIRDVVSALHDGVFVDGKIYWCFTKFVRDGLTIAANAKEVGKKPIVLWKEDNPDWQYLMNDERRAALHTIRAEQRAPDGYDFIIITSIGGRSWNIYDRNIQDWICNSTDYEDVGQFIRARFTPQRQYLLDSVRGLVEFVRDGFNVEYYQWHSVDEVKTLLQQFPVYSQSIEKRKMLTTIPELKKEYGDLIEYRRYGKNKVTQYRIKPAA